MGVPTNLIPTPITGLPEYTGSETIGYLPYVIDGRTFKVQFSNIAAAGAVPASRVIAAGTGLAGGGDLSANRVISIAAGGVGFDQLAVSGVAQGTYGSGSAIPVLTVDAKGRVTSATTAALNVTGFVPTSRTILAGDGLVGGGSLASNLTFSANFSAATPSALGTASAGTAITVSRGDHVHPAVDLSDTTQTQGALPLGRGGTGDALSPVAGAVVYSTGTKFALTDPGLPGQFLLSNGTGEPQWQTVSGSGTVTSVSVATANGFAGTVANPNIAAIITLQTTVNGILKGDGTGVSASIITDNGTNVGIGTASPTEKLSVNGNAIVGVEGGAGYVFGRRTGNIMAGEDASGSFLFAGINVTTPPNLTIGRMNTDTIFQTNGGLERMRIASGGNVGIGTSAPLARVHTYGGAGGINAIFESSTAADTRIEMKNNATRAGYLYWDANEVRTLADTSRYITSYTGGVERMRITSDGNVGLGTTAPAGSGQRVLEIAGVGGGVNDYGSLSLRNASESGGGTAGSVDFKGSTITYSAVRSFISTGGASGNGQLRFFTLTAGSLTNKATLDQNGRFSTNQLEVVGASAFGVEWDGLLIKTNNTGAGANGRIVFQDYNANPTSAIRGIYPGGTSTGSLSFMTNAGSGLVEHMRVTSAGRVGVGTATPAAKLQVSDSGGYGIEFSPLSAGFANIQAYDRTGSAFIPFSLTSSYITFQTNGTTERARIDTNGKLLVGTTASQGGADVVATRGFNSRFVAVGANATVTVSIPSSCICIIGQDGFSQDGAIFALKIGGGSKAAAVIAQNTAGAYGFGTTTDPNTGTRTDLWVSADNTLSIKDKTGTPRNFSLTLLSLG